MNRLPESEHTTKPQRISEGRNVTIDGQPARVVVELRHDDTCGNGHNTFAITGEWFYRADRRNSGGGGCIHDVIAEHFPEYAHMIRWHLTSTDGPIHYLANTLFLAGDRDHWGRHKGEPSSFEIWVYVGTSPIGHKVPKRLLGVLDSRPSSAGSIVAVPHPRNEFADQYYLGAMGEALAWHEAPFRTEREAGEWAAIIDSGDYRVERVPVEWSNGKEPEVEAARRTAIWPDATLEQLTDRGALEARLPGLLQEFKADIEALGMVY